jgi:hypothetical protein
LAASATVTSKAANTITVIGSSALTPNSKPESRFATHKRCSNTQQDAGPRLSPCTSTRDVVSIPVEAQGEQRPEQSIDLPQGTLDLLILRTLALGPMHGWPFRNASISFPARFSKSIKDRCIQRCIPSSAAAGSKRTGARRKTTAVRNTTSSSEVGGSSAKRKRRVEEAGGCHRPGAKDGLDNFPCVTTQGGEDAQ